MLKALPDGRTLLIVGQKNGDAWALDTAKQGAIVWKRLVGRGLDAGGGGMMWGNSGRRSPRIFPSHCSREYGSHWTRGVEERSIQEN
ncbi:MAG: hypothetical protein WDO18_17220 [Acidobacteriota bacterium]